MLTPTSRHRVCKNATMGPTPQYSVCNTVATLDRVAAWLQFAHSAKSSIWIFSIRVGLRAVLRYGESTPRYATWQGMINVAIFIPPNCYTSDLLLRAPFSHLFPRYPGDNVPYRYENTCQTHRIQEKQLSAGEFWALFRWSHCIVVRGRAKPSGAE